MTNAVAHLVWNPMVDHWQFVAAALLFTTLLIFWLVKEWPRLQLFATRFYCVVATFDLLAEGLLQPVHHCTLDNLMCTGRMYLIFFAFWLVSQPLEGRLWSWRRSATPATGMD